MNAGAAEEYAPTRRVSNKYGAVLYLVSHIKGRGTGARTDLKRTKSCPLDGKARKEKWMAEPWQEN